MFSNIEKALIPLLSALGWLVGILFILIGVGNLFDEPKAGLVIILGGLLFIPKVIRWILSLVPNSRITPELLVVIGFFTTVSGLIASTNDPAPLPSDEKTSTLYDTASSSNFKPAIETSQNANQVYCKVVGVSDGDTLTCLTKDKVRMEVRLAQIDAPEKNQAFGQSAKKALSKYVFGKSVKLRLSGKDNYKRDLAEVFVDDKNINKEMVVDGYAWAYREYMKDPEYAQLEESAKIGAKGLWSQPNPIPPSEFRHGVKEKPSAPVVAAQQPSESSIERPVVEHPIVKPKSSGSSCGSKYYCKEMDSCAEAQHYLNDCGLTRLDRDGDGVGCDNLCR